jgi:hypothetical protein
VASFFDSLVYHIGFVQIPQDGRHRLCIRHRARHRICYYNGRGSSMLLFFAYIDFMEVGGFNKEGDFAKLRPTLVIASSLVLAIRTAKWPRHTASTGASPGMGCRSRPFSRDSKARTVALDIAISDNVSAKGCALVSADR